ncbi:MAG: hypothetical protein ABIE94_00310 [archaeon]
MRKYTLVLVLVLIAMMVGMASAYPLLIPRKAVGDPADEGYERFEEAWDRLYYAATDHYRYVPRVDERLNAFNYINDRPLDEQAKYNILRVQGHIANTAVMSRLFEVVGNLWLEELREVENPVKRKSMFYSRFCDQLPVLFRILNGDIERAQKFLGRNKHIKADSESNGVRIYPGWYDDDLPEIMDSWNTRAGVWSRNKRVWDGFLLPEINACDDMRDALVKYDDLSMEEAYALLDRYFGIAYGPDDGGLVFLPYTPREELRSRTE